jgi:hypothetical protein
MSGAIKQSDSEQLAVGLQAMKGVFNHYDWSRNFALLDLRRGPHSLVKEFESPTEANAYAQGYYDTQSRNPDDSQLPIYLICVEPGTSIAHRMSWSRQIEVEVDSKAIIALHTAGALVEREDMLAKYRAKALLEARSEAVTEKMWFLGIAIVGTIALLATCAS